MVLPRQCHIWIPDTHLASPLVLKVMSRVALYAGFTTAPYRLALSYFLLCG